MARTHFVYRAYDDADRLLYVGCTKNLKQRRAGHRQGSAWFAYAVRFTVSGPYEQATARKKESEEIESKAPYFNANRSQLRHQKAWNARSRRLMQEFRTQRQSVDFDTAADFEEFSHGWVEIQSRVAKEIGPQIDTGWRMRRYLEARGGVAA